MGAHTTYCLWRRSPCFSWYLCLVILNARDDKDAPGGMFVLSSLACSASWTRRESIAAWADGTQRSKSEVASDVARVAFLPQVKQLVHVEFNVFEVEDVEETGAHGVRAQLGCAYMPQDVKFPAERNVADGTAPSRHVCML